MEDGVRLSIEKIQLEDKFKSNCKFYKIFDVSRYRNIIVGKIKNTGDDSYNFWNNISCNFIARFNTSIEAYEVIEYEAFGTWERKKKIKRNFNKKFYKGIEHFDYMIEPNYLNTKNANMLFVKALSQAVNYIVKGENDEENS